MAYIYMRQDVWMLRVQLCCLVVRYKDGNSNRVFKWLLVTSRFQPSPSTLSLLKLYCLI